MAIVYGANYGTPTLDLNFAKNKSLIDTVSGLNLVTFTRASTGTYVGADGLIKTAVANEARFDHDPLTGECLGLLIEEARTNSIWPSAPSTSSARNVAGSPGNAWAVYDGTTASGTRNGVTGLEVTINSSLDSNGFTGGNATNWGGIGGGGDHAANTTASVSFLIHPLTWTGNIWIGKLPSDGNNTFASQNFLLFNNGSYVGPAANVKGVFPDGTYWLHNIPWTSLSTNTAPTQFLAVFTTTPGDNAKKYWAGGFQWEAGAFSTSYIPTTGSTVTRSADVASITGTNFSRWYNQSEGTMFAYALNPKALGRMWEINDNTGLSRLFSAASPTGCQFVAGASGTTFWNQTVATTGTSLKSALAFQSGNYGGVANGLTPINNADSRVPSVNRMWIGGPYDNGSVAQYFNGTLARLTYYPTRLQDLQLQQLTK